MFSFNFLKGQLHEIFDPRFVHQSTPPRALIHGLKLFAYGLIFAEKIDNIRISVGSMTPLKQFTRAH
jgi:hypothetical protein